jgi:hypothetical protein
MMFFWQSRTFQNVAETACRIVTEDIAVATAADRDAGENEDEDIDYVPRVVFNQTRF